jgi:hypothetical protein
MSKSNTSCAIEDMMAAIGTNDYVLGGLPRGQVAREWIAAGVTASQASAYVAAGCWDPESVADLIAAGVTPEHLGDRDILARVEAAGSEITTRSLAYAQSAGDITAQDIADAIEAEIR